MTNQSVIKIYSTIVQDRGAVAISNLSRGYSVTRVKGNTAEISEKTFSDIGVRVNTLCTPVFTEELSDTQSHDFGSA